MWNKGQLREGLVKYHQDVQSGKIKHDGNKARNGGWRSSAATLKGCAPDQTLQVIRDFAGRLRRTPSFD